MRRVEAFVRAVASRERGLFVVGLGGVLLAGVCLVGVAIHGRHLAPEGKLLDAAAFCFGVGLYTLTIAVLLPHAGYSNTGRRRFRRAFYVFAVYGLVLETLQAFRGLDPRFTEHGTVIDQIAGVVFGATAGLTTVLFVLLAVRFFRGDVPTDRPILRLGIRYGAVAVMISFGVGVIMSVAGGRELGDDGDLLLTHALGVHGLQVVPIVAVTVSDSSLAWPRRWVHVAGSAWLAACAGAFLQALLGEPPLEPTPLSALVVIGVMVFVLTMAAAAVSSVRSTRWQMP